MPEGRPQIIRETDGEAIALAKSLMRSARYGALAVLDQDTGAPLASRVAVATDLDGSPIVLVSSLAAHTGAMVADARCSLLLGEPGKGDPLAHPRITLSCLAQKLERGGADAIRAERRYLNRHPKAKLYSGFSDFAFFKLVVQRGSLNGGFGKAYLLGEEDLVVGGPATDGLAEIEQSAVDHMNESHRDAAAVYATAFAKAAEGDWSVTGFDAEGMDLASGDQVRRVLFPQPLQDADELRKVLVEMAKAGRAQNSVKI